MGQKEGVSWAIVTTESTATPQELGQPFRGGPLRPESRLSNSPHWPAIGHNLGQGSPLCQSNSLAGIPGKASSRQSSWQRVGDAWS